MVLLPGTMVLIIQNAWESLPDYLLLATKGSIARAMSFTEYEDYCSNKISKDFLASHLQQVRQWMAYGEQFPFMFIEVAPPSKSLEGSFYVNDCQIGEVVILDGRFFQIIEDFHSA